MSESAPSETQQRQAPIALWQAAHALITALFNLFGAPEEIAAQRTLTKDARALLLSRLRAAEAVVRRLIFIEAMKLPPSERGRSVTQRPEGGPRTHEEARAFDSANPDAWRVSFRCSVSSRRSAGKRHRRHRAPRALYARPLAER